MPTTTDLIPPEWEAIRQMVEVALGPCVIVGGALRDLDHGKPVKDLDLFVQADPALDRMSRDEFDTELQAMKARLRAWVPGLEITGTTDPEYATAMREEVVYVFTCAVPDVPQEVQVILARLAEPRDAIRRVDYGLCMIGWDGKELIRCSEYDIDKAFETFTMYRADCAAHHEYSVKRFDRLSAKYPGYRLIDLSPWTLSNMAAF